MIPKDCKRLAEVDFPIAEVSRRVGREKGMRRAKAWHRPRSGKGENRIVEFRGVSAQKESGTFFSLRRADGPIHAQVAVPTSGAESPAGSAREVELLKLSEPLGGRTNTCR